MVHSSLYLLGKVKTNVIINLISFVIKLNKGFRFQYNSMYNIIAEEFRYARTIEDFRVCG